MRRQHALRQPSDAKIAATQRSPTMHATHVASARRRKRRTTGHSMTIQSSHSDNMLKQLRRCNCTANERRMNASEPANPHLAKCVVAVKGQVLNCKCTFCKSVVAVKVLELNCKCTFLKVSLRLRCRCLTANALFEKCVVAVKVLDLNCNCTFWKSVVADKEKKLICAHRIGTLASRIGLFGKMI